MKATATHSFTAHIDGREVSGTAGQDLELTELQFARLSEAGLVAKPKRAKKGESKDD